MAKKVWLPILLLLVMLVQAAAACHAAAREYYYDNAWHPYNGNEFSLKVNGKTLDTSMPPIVFDGYSVVPAREVFEFLGAKVDWDGANAIVKVTYEGKILMLRINSTSAQVGTRSVTMPIAPKIINEKTMIPVRFTAEQMGLTVDFDSAADAILIEKPKPSVEITSVKWETNRADTAGFVTVMTNAGKAEYSAFEMAEPDRIVLDVKNAANCSGKSSIAIHDRNVEQIRIGQHEDSTRIVIDLADSADYVVESDGPSVVVTIRLKDLPSAPPASSAPSTGPSAPPPSASPSEPPATAKPMSRYVTIDAGHGGTDPGAVYKDEDGNAVAEEKDINLGVALKVQKKLEAAGVRVHMIRTTDTYVDFQKVGSIANEMGTSLFVSVHTNSFVADNASGIETWGYLDGGSDYGGMTSKKLSQNILDELIKATGANNRGVKDGKELAVIRTTEMPATLVELGFITNTEERQKMMSESYRDTLAEAIATGILKSLTEMGL